MSLGGVGQTHVPHLHLQSVRQIIGEFCEAVHATRQLWRNDHPEANYPWCKPTYRDVVYTNQAARVRNGKLVLPHGQAGTPHIPLSIALPGRLMEVRLQMGNVLLVCEIPDEPRPQQTVIGVDLGMNTLIAATDSKKAILISRCETRATVQWRNKCLAQIQQAQSTRVKDSRRWRRLQRHKARMLAKAHRRIRDITHKATCQVADAFPGATCHIGKPFNDAAQKMSHRQAQHVSEAFSSQTCPVCGERNTCQCIYRCKKCHFTMPRDAVGSTNILCIGKYGTLVSGCRVPNTMRFILVRILARARCLPGHGARCSG